MSTLWTPSGEYEPSGEEGATSATGAPTAPSDAAPDTDNEYADVPPEVAEELRRVRAELAATPAADIVANHAVGLWQLAILHLTPDDVSPRLSEASLAIDAMAAIVEGLGERLGEHARALNDALAQLRLAFVQVQGRLRDESTAS